jgi:predicted DNA-binding protein with PD1-like motif
MFSKELTKQSKDFVLRLCKGEEIIASISNFCKSKNLKSGTISGIGAVNYAKVGIYNLETKKYESSEFNKPMEICSLIGNISCKDNEPYLHIHISLSDTSSNIFGGHLNSAIISVTGEFFISCYEETIEREMNDETGINFFKL